MPTIKWQGIEVEYSYTQPTYCSPYHHIELHAKERLPVTETGYRSHFIHPQELELWPCAEAFVLDWLNVAASSCEWKEYQQQSRQGSLF